MKNLTITIPEAVLERLRVMAAKRQQSLNRFVGEVLGELASGSSGEWQASHRALYQDIKGLRSKGEWTRDEIYESRTS